MISQSRKWAPPKRNLRNRIGAIALLGMLASVGCDSLLDVTVPGRIASDRLEDPALAELTTRSVQAAWECALSQYAGASGLFGTELIHASNLGSRDNFGNRIYSVAETSGATNTCPTGDGLFSISGAPYAALALGRDVTLRYEAWTETELKNRARHIAYTATYTAYAMTILGEGFCQAVVESFGPALDPPDVFRAAETWFTKGLTFAETAGEAPARNLALVGRARVRLNLRNYDGAVADAERVPAGFVYNATRGTVLERVNRVWGETYRSRSMSVHPSFYNLTVGGVPDTRVRVQNMNARGADGITPSWFSLKNATADASVRAASWEEAQLIIAESRLGQIAVDRINAVRQKYALPLYAPANVTDRDAILNQVIEERRREFFLEGHWLNDMIRHKGRPGTAFNEGVNHQGVTTYRPLYCIPLPLREKESNPNANAKEGITEAVR